MIKYGDIGTEYSLNFKEVSNIRYNPPFGKTILLACDPIEYWATFFICKNGIVFDNDIDCDRTISEFIDEFSNKMFAVLPFNALLDKYQEREQELNCYQLIKKAFDDYPGNNEGLIRHVNMIYSHKNCK